MQKRKKHPPSHIATPKQTDAFPTKVVDLVVIGGGASGLMAACSYAEEIRRKQGKGSVWIVEKASRVGKKLLATGNGRCNLSNTHAADPSYYHGGVEEIAPLLQEYSPQKVQEIFARLGLLCRIDGEGRMYPYNVQASAVLEILCLCLEKYGIPVCCGFPVVSACHEKGIFSLRDPQGRCIQARQVIVATGGKAAPQLGSDGSGFEIAKRFGHSCTPLIPALVPVQTPAARVKPLKGMRSQAVASLWIDGKKEREEKGEVQFTEQGLSGICIFQLSRRANQRVWENPQGTVEISLDLMPEWGDDPIACQIERYVKQYPFSIAQHVLDGMINQRVGQEVVKIALGGKAVQPASQCGKKDCHAIARQVKSFSFPIIGQMPWEMAQVTAGGVCCKEISPYTLESNKQKGLYFCGEVLDIDGDCGGFNLHWAWCSGWAAGKAAAQKAMRGGKA